MPFNQSSSSDDEILPEYQFDYQKGKVNRFATQVEKIEISEHLWRFPTRESIASLASKLNLPIQPYAQDWQWQVANSNRIEEFLNAYTSMCLTDDEKFTLMEVILQSFEDLDQPLEGDSRWQEVLAFLDQNIDIHIYSVYYWSALESENEDEQWRVTPFVRKILEKHKTKFEQ